MMTFTGGLLAKPKAPIEMSFEQKSLEPLGDEARYECEVVFTPLSSSDLVKVKLSVPESCQLVEGFSYWEGQLKAGESFKKTVVVHGPVADVHTLTVMGTMEMGSAKAMKSLDLSLNGSTVRQKAVFPLVPRTSQRTKSENGSSSRRINRE
jgi:hypothetical protein